MATSSLFEHLDLRSSVFDPLDELKKGLVNLNRGKQPQALLPKVDDLIYLAQDGQREFLAGFAPKGVIPMPSSLPVLFNGVVLCPADSGYKAACASPDAQAVLGCIPVLDGDDSNPRQLSPGLSMLLGENPPLVALPLFVLCGSLFFLAVFPSAWVKLLMIAIFMLPWALFAAWVDWRRDAIRGAVRAYLQNIPLAKNVLLDKNTGNLRFDIPKRLVGRSFIWQQMLAMSGAAVLLSLGLGSPFIFVGGIITVLSLLYIWGLVREFKVVMSYTPYKPYLEAKKGKPGEDGLFEAWLQQVSDPTEREKYLAFGVLAVISQRLKLKGGLDDLTSQRIAKKLL